jgi:hypothetical protein
VTRAADAAPNRTFQEVAKEPIAGMSFERATTTFLSRLRASRGYELQSASFTALRENPVCDARIPSCAPDPSFAPVREWDGMLAWRERPDNGPWNDSSCEVLAILTRAEGWYVEGSRWCDLSAVMRS